MSARASVDGQKLRPPPLHTSGLQRPSTASRPGSPTSEQPQTPRLPKDGQLLSNQKGPSASGHQRFVLTDPVAFRYLEGDASTTVLERRAELPGYECYIVEQWTTSRTHPTFLITTFTGDPSHVVVVGVLNVPIDESTWSPRLRVYFKALNQYHARRRETPLGIMMVTNLSGFPSSLTVIPVPGGDIAKHRYDFFVNENLKRLGCSGRVGLTLAPPAASTVAKFHQLYRTSDKNEVYKSVIELVKLCQSALMLFDKLEIDYADGLLCDVTERAINDWWVDIGTEQYNIEPHDGILGPTTVAGLLGLLMGVRNRLHSVNTSVSKDPFDVQSIKSAIGTFQKQQRLPRTRRLDRRTLGRLQSVTQKAADKERWAVPKAVKSTMAELSGKGGEMVMDAVGRRDRAGLADIESVDLDRFVQLLYGARCKWLWLGKPIKRSKISDGDGHAPDEASEPPKLNNGLIFKPDEHGGFTWTAGRKSTAEGLTSSKNDRYRTQDNDDYLLPTPGEDVDDSDGGTAKSAVFKRATGFRSEARSGLDKVKGVVGLRGHKSKHSHDDSVPTSPVVSKRPSMLRSHTSPVSSPNSPERRHAQRQDAAAIGSSDRLNIALSGGDPSFHQSSDLVEQPASRVTSHDGKPPSAEATVDSRNSKETVERPKEESRTVTTESSVAGSTYHGIYLNETLPTGPETGADVNLLLRRTTSYSQYVNTQLQSRPDGMLPRHLSFSLAEESVLEWPHVTADDEDPFGVQPVSKVSAQLVEQEYVAKEAKQLRALIHSLEFENVAWTQEQLGALDAYLDQTDRDHEKLEGIFHPHVQEVQALQLHSEGMLRQEKEHLEEGVKEIETLAAKLEYEINGLRSRVEDVEAGVGDFEKGVVRVEERVAELEKEGEKGSKWGCVLQ